MDNFSFVALDIETATGKRSSICEIGITIVKDSKIAESKSWLIQPKDNSYWRRNIEIHGINPEDTQMVTPLSLRLDSFHYWGLLGTYTR